MKILFLVKAEREWHNGLLIYNEAVRQGVDAHLLKHEDYGNLDIASRKIVNLYKLEADIQSINPDWTFITGSRKRPDVYKIAKKYSKVAVWDADLIDAVRYSLWQRICPYVDLAFVSTRSVHDRIKDFINSVWTMQYFDNNFINSNIERGGTYKYDICFLRSYTDPNRVFVESLLKSKYRCFFAGGDHPPFAVHGGRAADVYRQSKIAIDIKRSHPYFNGGFDTSDRIFKAMGSGCFFLTYNIPLLDLFFEPDKELVVYHDYNDMVKKIDFYLDNQHLREQIASRGKEKIFEKHLISERVKKYLFEMERNL